jgi:hypothetical protein
MFLNIYLTTLVLRLTNSIVFLPDLEYTIERVPTRLPYLNYYPKRSLEPRGVYASFQAPMADLCDLASLTASLTHYVVVSSTDIDVKREAAS